MTNKNNNDEIDLTELVKTFWDKKINIFLIILVSIFVGIGLAIEGKNFIKVH